MNRRVVVTGLGVVTSLSCKVDDLFLRLVEGESGVGRLQALDEDEFKVKIAGEVRDWAPGEYIDRKELKRLDRFTQFALVAGVDAVTHCGLDLDREDSFRCGVILGSGIGGLGEIETQVRRLAAKGPSRVSPMTVPKMMMNAAGGCLSIRYGMRGQNYTVTTACASATNAMGNAFKAIQHSAADVVVTGGTEAALTAVGLSAFQNMKALSRRNDEPQAASRPFDSDRDGFVLGEGAGLLVFEELQHAKARGAEIYAEILGFGASGDAGHITQPNEEGVGAAVAMQTALDDAGLNNDQVDYINAHGTSTPLGDIAETRAIKRVFGDHAQKLSISSTKSNLGHSLGASGGIELAVAIHALARNVVPPTINLENPDPQCDLDYTPLQPRERQLRVAMSNSFGFGGHNASIIVGKLADA
jgi:3-oxoacyl-[acyl-carrier-protein] synthase II